MESEDIQNCFTIKKRTKIEEIDVELVEIVHKKTGAEIIHIVADDDENLFSLCFKTYPHDDTGAAHILEHTVLCGSRKYPVQDPFFSMLRRSSNTFMNALTSKLWTCYPAASKIEKDFYNLFDIYIDAVFYPLLRKESFLQEGHRLEFEKPKDPNSPLLLKGIVYNEMKGAYANPTSYLWRKLMASLCEGSVYGNDSGGDPECIPMLSYEDLLNFHATYYDPSRCIYYLYGNIPTEKHLAFLETKILGQAERKTPIPPTKHIDRYKKRKYEIAHYACQDTDLKQKTFIAFGFLTTKIEEEEELLALALLDSILMETDASLLKQKLLSSKLCIQASSSYDPDAPDIPVAFILRGCEQDQADLVEALFFKSLEEIAEEGIPQNLISSALHQLEFSRSEIGSGGEPYGLELMGRTLLPYLQGGSLFEGLKIHSLIHRLEILTKDPSYLPSLLRKHYINNQHMCRLILAPDPDLLQKQEEKEAATLKAKQKGLTPLEIETILKETKAQEAYRKNKEKEDTSCLPILGLEDIPKQVSYFPIDKHSEGELAIYHHSVFTNRIIYADIVFDLPQIEEQDLPYLRLFASLITELGAGGRNYIDNLNYIQENIGGIWTSLSLNVQKGNTQSCYPTIAISGKALEKKSHALFHLFKDFILSPNFNDQARIKELIIQSFTGLQHRLNSQAIGYALKESTSGFSPWNHVNNLWHGLPYFKFLENLVKTIDQNIEEITSKLKNLSRTIFHLNNPHLLLACDKGFYETLKNEGFYGFPKFSEASTPFRPWVELATPKQVQSSGRILASPIANNVMALSTATLSSEYAAPLKIASYLFENLEVHKKVRELGGAYSSGVKYNILTGNYQFYSSRDPNITSTYLAFKEAIERVSQGEFTEQDLLEAKLSYIQDVDGVVPPGSRAAVTYFQHKVGLTKAIRQAFRDQVLATTREEIAQAVHECLLGPSLEGCVRITYASESLLKKEASSFEEKGFPKMLIQTL